MLKNLVKLHELYTLSGYDAQPDDADRRTSYLMAVNFAESHNTPRYEALEEWLQDNLIHGVSYAIAYHETHWNCGDPMPTDIENAVPFLHREAIAHLVGYEMDGIEDLCADDLQQFH